MRVWPSRSFRADVFRLAKAPAKSDRFLRLYRESVPFSCDKIRKQGSADGQSRSLGQPFFCPPCLFSPPADRTIAYVAPPPPKVTGRRARSSRRSRAISKRPATRPRSIRPIWSRACRASSRDQLHRRRPGQEGHRRCSPSSRSPTSSSSSRRKAAEAERAGDAKQTQAEYDRQADLVQRQRLEGGHYDKAHRHRDSAQANLHAGAGQHQAGRRSISTTPSRRRRSTAS